MCSGSCSPDVVIPDKNPDPKNFRVITAYFNSEFTVAKVEYPDWDNYEGVKILVYKGKVTDQLMAAKTLDPHFCDTCELSPIARFEPTEEGIALAFMLTRVKR